MLMIICLICLIKLFIVPVYAEVYFYDSFSEKILNKWVDVGSSDYSKWYVNDGKLVGYVYPRNSSRLQAKWNENCEVKDFKVEADVVNVSGVDQTFYLRISNDGKSYYQVGYRYNEPAHSQDNNNITLNKFVNGVQVDGDRFAQYPGQFPRSVDITQNVSHKIKIIISDRNIQVFFDDFKAIDYFDYKADAIQCGGVALLNWGGHCSVPTHNTFDNIIISTPDESWQIPKNKIIFIPGLGASWNAEALVFNRKDDKLKWKMTPFVKNYEKFFEALEENDLVRDEDYFVWNYDWRQPLEDIVGEFDKYLNSTVKSSETVQIVGHSLGGVVGRIWLQENLTDPRIKKVIAAGSPQSGALDPYTLWNGGRMIGRGNAATAALSILAVLQNRNYKNKVEAMRAYAPVIKDLIPVFNFAKKDGITLNFLDITNRNDYLIGKNNYNNLGDKYMSVYGTGFITTEWINLGKQSKVDKINNIWPDGKPKSYVDGDGDITVLPVSAIVSGSRSVKVNSNHGDIISAGGGEILEALGLNGEVGSTDTKPDKRKLLFITSAAKLEVNCPNVVNYVSDDDGFALMDGDVKSCRINIIGKENGEYQLVIGEIGNDQSWKYYENDIKSGEMDNLILDGKNDDWWKELIIRDVNLLFIDYPGNKYLQKIVEKINKKQIFEVLDEVLKFREETEEMLISRRVIGYVGNMLEENAVNIKKSEIQKLLDWEGKRLELNENYTLKMTLIEAANFEIAREYVESASVYLEEEELKKALAAVFMSKKLVR